MRIHKLLSLLAAGLLLAPLSARAEITFDGTVVAGDAVDAGEALGVVGNTSLSESGLGAHLHFSVTRDGELMDPEAYLAG